MRILEIKLNHVKKILEEKIFKFDENCIVNTISGKNGSGKSTVFESAILCQKAYFIKQLEDYMEREEVDYLPNLEEIERDFSKELGKIVANQKTEVELVIRFYNHDLKSKYLEHKYHSDVLENGESVFDVSIKLIINCNKKGLYKWEIEINEKNCSGILGEFWNIQDPSQIIVFLDAEKNVYEEDFTYQKISMITEDDINPIVQFILYPKNIYQNMYDIMMNAYAYQRINPQTPKKDLFFTLSKEMYSQLISDVEISNFSGKESKNQFVLMSKNNYKFDARNMSSGEKLIWYSLLLLNYVRELGVLIIDEPENHLHEQLAWKYVSFLKKIADERKAFKIEQVFLITHAKNLIYNNFADGVNYLIDNGNLLKIQQKTCEAILRTCGISYIDDKVLFVEGKSEINIFSKLCELMNIRIRQLANCSEIIQVYKSLIKVKELVYAPKFVFIIDGDTRDDDEIQEIKKLDDAFFEQHFAILPVHEIENFLLDENVIKKAIDQYLDIGGTKYKDKDEIYTIIRKYADDSLEDTKRKFLNNAIREKMNMLKGLIKQKEIDVTNKQNYEQYIDSVILSEKYNYIVNEIKKKYDVMMERYDALNWSQNWKRICDGKRVLNQSLTQIEKEIGISNENLIRAIIKIQLNNSQSEMYKFWHEVLHKVE